ncbi:choice-of-anchor Q domain-containing protein [Streptomyces sp. NPDC020362]|uniref:choice-of-anchor Q domain-containing protein n=1 Tax=unclassified Streptomyces TaxID=2593676 RepID=UPI0033FD72D0
MPSPTPCAGHPQSCSPAAAGDAGSESHDIDGDGSCRLTAAGDLPVRAPLKGPLADDDATDTAALLPGSPALDAAADCPATDQRGSARPRGACDIGAHQHTP